jgi:hypothetical protein
LATALCKVEALKAELDSGRARKRKRVQINPNSKFADIEAIYKAQVEAGEVNDRLDESSESGLSSEGEDCIVVEPRRVAN